MTGEKNQLELSKEQIDTVIALYSNHQYQEAIDKIIVLDESYPNVPLLFNLIGACYKALGQLEVAAKMFEKAVGIKPDYAEAHKNLGITLRDLGRQETATESLKRAIEVEPNYVDAHYNLAIIFKDFGDLDAAVKSYEKTITLNPNFAAAHNNLGNVFKDLDKLDDAIKSYEKAITLNPNFAEAHYNLGVALKQLKQLDAAVSSLNNAITLKPDYAHAHNNLGGCFTLLGQMSLAIECYKKALTIKPDYAEAHNSLGNALNILGQIKAGANCFEKAIEINPNFAEAHNSLGNIFKKLKQRDKALLCYERAFAIKPDMDFNLGDILNAKMHLCIWDDFSILLNSAKKKIINNKKVFDPFNLMGLIDDPALQRKVTELMVNSSHPKSNALSKIELYPKHKKIRIGYFSADFKEHPVGYLTAGLYEAHNRNHFEVHAFSFGPDTKDEINLRIKAGVDQFHDVQSMAHKEVTLLARSLEIDIAIDLTGLTAKARTDVFAMSAAPIQVSYIGFLGTMGADYYDYLIADPVMIPKKNQKYYSEKIIYLPSFQVNDSKDLPPDISFSRKEVGLPEEGFIFCCFNNTYKFTPAVFDSWARILQSVKGSILIVYANNELSKTNLTKEIVRRGIEAERLIFGASLDRPEYMARYRVADLFLDTQPYNAGTTASDALRMGLPMLTLIGESYQARMGASILSALNLPELITNSPEEYELLAIELASNPEKLKSIKEKLASNLSTAPLYNTKLFTKNLEAAFTEVHERYHQGLESDHIYL